MTMKILATDYNLFVDRYDRLADINSTRPVIYQQAPPAQGYYDALLQYLIRRSLSQRSSDTIRLQISHCTRLLALCAQALQ